ncbi:MAG: bacillithiol biosynthesis cysteine-adding enzyme BshC [Chitinophagales bacterium]|nr:bacillithiol biosynthesis cysteine-adding enzyme BshC [Chitinophagaceae bacterium]MCB9063634.1 bacillithiol biosynthesis cysteine-adding enzyme BshC [Chitinophagales bacterium]
MDCKHRYIPYGSTGSFTTIVEDYLQGKDSLSGFYKYSPDAAGVKRAIADRAQFPVNRKVLVDTLQKQYRSIETDKAVTDNIASLANDNTFTVCTAHQPNLLTGYLYFIYKIVHAIKLADELNEQHPDKHFVPVYYMGSEDNDLEELGTFRYSGKKYTWDAAGQKGAFGRMDTKTLKSILDELFRVLGPPNNETEQLKEVLTTAYLKHNNISDATQYLADKLFGRYGLVVLNPDEAAFKNEILNILEDDLLTQTPGKLVANQAAKLSEYKTQAYPRDINLFYLQDQLRERIEKDDDVWKVLNTDIVWSKEELLNELKQHPERFSPNVILRGIFQETILPNIAFIGGGAEVAYWLQLKNIFEHYNVFYPAVLLRQSILWEEPGAKELQEKLGLTDEELFLPIDKLITDHITSTTTATLSTEDEAERIEQVLTELKQKATSLDKTLEASAEAALAKMKYQLVVLEKKMLRAEKRNRATETERFHKLKNMLFPNGNLQERYENFMEYYTLYGSEFIDCLYACTDPLKNKFLIISPNN